jgi:hypothetical protein
MHQLIYSMNTLRVQEVAPRFYATIENGQCSSLANETSAKVDQFLPGFQWVYGPGAEGMLFDGQSSLTVVQKTLRELNVPIGSMIEFFAREKRGQRIAL